MSKDKLVAILWKLKAVEHQGVKRLKVLALLTLVAVFGVGYLAYSALDVGLKLDKPLRLLASGSAFTILCLVLVLFAIRTVRARIGAKKAALEVEERFRDLESSVSTSVEFGMSQEKTLRLSSPQVVGALISHTAQRAEGVNFLQAINWRIAARVGAGAACVALVCLLYFVALPRVAQLTFLRFVAPWANLPAPTLTWAEIKPGSRDVRRLETVEITANLSGRLPKTAAISFAVVPEDAAPGAPLQWRAESMLKTDAQTFTFSFPRMLDSVRYCVSAGDFRSDEFLLNVYEVPKITQLKMVLTYPAYTGMKPKVAEDAVGPITALRGTEVQLTGVVNKTIGNAAIQFDAETDPQVPANEVKGNQFRVDFKVGDHSKYRLLVTDLQRRTNDDAAFYTIKCIDDNPPEVKLTKPGKNLTMIKTAEVPLEVQTSDDYGLSEAGIAYKIKEEEWKRLPLKDLKPKTKEGKFAPTLYLEEMELADTDVVTYYAYARDNDTVSGPKESASDIFFVEIEPFGQQYKWQDQAGNMPGGEDGKKLVMKLEDIIKKQKEVITKTFRVDKEILLKKKIDEEKVAQVKDLGSQENDLRKRTDELSQKLQEQLVAFGLTEDLDRVENLDRAGVRMGLASLVLDALDTSGALPYENDALYHLYRAKRDILNLIAKHAGNKEVAKQLRQALDMAAKSQQEDEQRERQEKIKELQEKAEELAQMQQEQKDINKQLHEQAAQQAQAQSQSGKEQPSQQQKQQREEMAKHEEELAKRADDAAMALRRMDFNNPNQSYKAANDTAKAGMEMREAQKTLKEQKMADARDHGVKAEKNIAKALKGVQRALERSVTEQLHDAANQAKDLAENQRQLGNETEQLAQAQQQGQQEQAQRGQTQPQGQPQQGQKQQGQPQGKPEQGQQKEGQKQQAQQGQQQQGQQEQAKQGQQPQQGEQAQAQQGQQQAQQGKPEEGAQAQAPQGQKPEAGQQGKPQAAQGEQKAQQGKPEQGPQAEAKPGEQAQAQQGKPQAAQGEQKAQQGKPQAGAAQQEAKQGQPQAAQGKPGAEQAAQGRPDRQTAPVTPKEAEKKRGELAERQNDLRKDANRLAETLTDLAPRVKEVDPEIGAGVDKEAEAMKSDRAQKPMERAEKALQKNELPRARADQKAAQRPLDETAKNLRDLAEQFTMDDSQRMAKAIEKAKELAEKQDTLNKRVEQMARAPQPEQQQAGETAKTPRTEKEKEGKDAGQNVQTPEQAQAQQQANAQQKGQKGKAQPGQQAAQASQTPEELANNQRDIREGTESLAKQVERLKSLEKSNLDQQIKESLSNASGHMAYSEQNIREKNPQASAAHGQQASSELRQSMKAMRRALTESLNERLAEAVEQARKTAQAQQNAKETLDKSAKEKNRGEPIPPEKQDRAAREQSEAQEGLNQLQRDLQTLSKQSRAAGEPPLAESVDKVQKDLDEAKTPQRMAQAQKEMKERNWPSARQNQQMAAASTSDAHEQLKDLYQDQTALPMQKMKNAVESTKQLAEDVKDMKKKVESLETPKAKPGEQGKGQEAQKLAQDQKELQKKAESLTDRVKRLDPNAQDLKQNADELNSHMKQVTERLAKGQTKDVTPGLNKASKALQSLGEGLIQRLNRLADKEKRRDPDEEKAPTEYRKLVEQYTRALSED
jgi:hypothetical protein